MSLSPKGSTSSADSFIKENGTVWALSENGCWLPAKIIAVEAAFVCIELESSGNKVEISREDSLRRILPRNASLGEERIDDLTGLAFLHEAAVLNTIRTRYLEHEIYTFSGIVLASVNPYTNVPIYGSEIIQAYHGHRRDELAPHLFAIAEESFQSLKNERRNQSIIVSGESGAGKTISAKYIMKYLAEVVCNSVELRDDSAEHIDEKILATNPILEAFGNAKTLRNDNSSRFGKYVQIFFDERVTMIGAAIKTFLLEKTRVVTVSEGERSFHIFYQILAGLDGKVREEFHLTDWKDFRVLEMSHTGLVEGENDQDDFQVTCQAMSTVGFGAGLQTEIFKILAGLLHLGNVRFSADSEGHAMVNQDQSFFNVAKLLGLDASRLACDLTRRKIVAGAEVVDAHNTMVQAEAMRDSMIKYIYSRLFDFLVAKLNATLIPHGNPDRFIGVLDIYGFEKFEVNSFEQFCINYANEKLQHQFNMHVFALEQKLYEEEGIDWSFVEYADNQACIELVEGKLGILELLDEECRFPNGSDDSFVAKLYKTRENSKSLAKKKLKAGEVFTVKHFAYDVEYDARGFLEKNRDRIAVELIDLLKRSQNEQLKMLVTEEWGGGDVAEGRRSREDTRKTVAEGTMVGGLTGVKQGGGSKASTGFAFKTSLIDLMSIIYSTKTHYIRCIKPNEHKQAYQFDSPFVMLQLRACGILETVRISSAGYPGRWPFAEFYARFRLLSAGGADGMKGSGTMKNGENAKDEGSLEHLRIMCIKLLGSLNISDKQYQVGKTRVFLRAGVLAELEDRRTFKIHCSAIRIQSIVRKYICVQRFETYGRSAICFQRYFAIQRARKVLDHLRRDQSARIVENAWRRRSGVMILRLTYRLGVTLEALWFARLGRCTLAQHRVLIALDHIYLAFKRYKAKRDFVAALHIAVAMQCRYRQNRSWLELLSAREEAKSLDFLKAVNDRQEAQIASLMTRVHLLEDALKTEREMKQQIEHQLEAEIVSVGNARADSKELNVAHQKILEQQNMIEELESVNTKIFEKNEELTNQLKSYKMAEVENNSVNSSLNGLRDQGHARSTSFDSRLIIGKGQLKHSVSRANFAEQNEVIRKNLDESLCLEELLTMMDKAIPYNGEIPSDVLLTSKVLSLWIFSWLRIGSDAGTVRDTFPRLITKVKLTCIATSQKSFDRLARRPNGVHQACIDHVMAYWISNFYDFLCFLQWAVIETIETGDLRCQQKGRRSGDEVDPNMALLIQIRTDVARFVEDMCRAWMGDLFKSVVRYGVESILDHQGLSSLEADGETSPIMSLKMFFTAKPSCSIEDFIMAMDDLIKAMDVAGLQADLAAQIISAILAKICAAAFNQLLLRKNYATWRRGIQVQYNISRLEEWATLINYANPGHFFSQSVVASPRPEGCNDRVSIDDSMSVLSEGEERGSSLYLSPPLPQIPISPGEGSDEGCIMNGRVVNGRIVDDCIAEDRIAEDRIAEDRIAEGRIAEGRIAEGRIAHPSHLSHSSLICMEPLVQACKLLQLAKTQAASDLDTLIGACPRLNLAQIKKILSVYVPDMYEDGPVSPTTIRSLTAKIHTIGKPMSETMVEVQPQVLPLQLAIKPKRPAALGDLCTNMVPPHLWRIFVLVESVADDNQN